MTKDALTASQALPHLKFGADWRVIMGAHKDFLARQHFGTDRHRNRVKVTITYVEKSCLEVNNLMHVPHGKRP